MAHWGGGGGGGISDAEYPMKDYPARIPRGREGYDGRRMITQQENYRDLQKIRQYLFRLFIIGAFLFLIFVGAVAALLYFSFEVAAHRKTLESIEEQTEQALIFLMDVLNSTSEVTKDITLTYSRAKMAHRRSVGSITQEEYEAYLSNNGINTHSSSNDPFANENHDNETYATHFMHILLRSLPLEDEDKMIVRFRNFFDGVDSLMYMFGEANRTGLVPNTTMIENQINRILYSRQAHRLALQGSEFASRAMTHSDELVQGFLAANHSIARVLGRLDELSRTKLASVLLENKHDVLSGIGHLGEESYEALHETIKFVKSEEGRKLFGDAEDIMDALNKFHTAKRASQVLQFLLTVGSRTLNVNIEDEEEVPREASEKDKKEVSVNLGEARGRGVETSPTPIVSANKERDVETAAPKQMPLRSKKGRKRSYN